jgi:hypothetical protein
VDFGLVLRRPIETTRLTRSWHAAIACRGVTLWGIESHYYERALRKVITVASSAEAGNSFVKWVLSQTTSSGL